MKRFALFALTLALMLPVSVHAQKKPGSNMWTRSAQLYMDRARANKVPDEQKALYKQAYDAAIQSVQKDSDNANGYLIAGQAALGMGELMRADSLLDRAEALYPPYEKETDEDRLRAWINLYNQGVAAINANKLDEAIALFERADVIYQKRPSARLTLASIYQNKGQLDKAAAEYKAALDVLRGPARKGLKPEDEKQWADWEQKADLSLAQLMAVTQKGDDAEKAYRDLIAKDPGNVAAKMNLAAILTRSGKASEAAQIYTELLGRTDLTDVDYFNAGVGLFQAANYPLAAEAFKKSGAANANFRDAHYNYAQALFAQAKALEDARAKASADRKKELAAQLQPLYNEIIAATERVLTLDPLSRTTLRLNAQALRGLGDISTDAKVVADYKARTMKLLERDDAMKFGVENVKLTQGEGGGFVLSGGIENAKLAAGAPVHLKVTFFGKDGAVLDTQDVNVTARAANEVTPFEVKYSGSGDVVGWKYEVVQ